MRIMLLYSFFSSPHVIVYFVRYRIESRLCGYERSVLEFILLFSMCGYERSVLEFILLFSMIFGFMH